MDNDKRECPNCAVEVKKEDGNCPICGYEFPPVTARHHLYTWVAVILIILFLIPVLVMLLRALK